jgi:hypothetical protein
MVMQPAENQPALDLEVPMTARSAHVYAYAREMQGDLEGAARGYADALRRDPEFRPARRHLALALVRLGRPRESVALCRTELAEDDTGAAWLGAAIARAMQEADLSVAGELAAILAALQRGSEWYPPAAAGPPPAIADLQISVPKLQHDLAQLRYLRELGVLDTSFDELIEGYADAACRHAALGDNACAALTPKDVHQIGRAYGRLVHVASAPRIDTALSGAWDRERVQRLYCEQRPGVVVPGVVVIDDFLTERALASLRRFCLESTVWSGNRYADGRLGSRFFAGFNCPLLLQLAEEIRDALPELIGPRHSLRQLWGVKYTRPLPPDSSVHADFAAVNVNVWITPSAANLDEASGGMVIYDLEVPPSWDFATYNERIDAIRAYLAHHRPRAIRVPYRQNRAVIFNSDLFHATEAVQFRPAYDSHRIDVTMLYGERNLDQHPPPRSEVSPAAWRSRAFARARR